MNEQEKFMLGFAFGVCLFVIVKTIIECIIIYFKKYE